MKRCAPSEERADAVAALMARNIDHPARELTWDAPGWRCASANPPYNDAGGSLPRPLAASSSGPTMSSGSGNTMVEFLSAAMTVRVSR